GVDSAARVARRRPPRRAQTKGRREAGDARGIVQELSAGGTAGFPAQRAARQCAHDSLRGTRYHRGVAVPGVHHELRPDTHAVNQGMMRWANALGIALLCAWAVVRTSRPPAPRPSSSPPQEFSAERAMTHVRAIAQRPHPMGSADHERVRDYIKNELARL